MEKGITMINEELKELIQEELGGMPSTEWNQRVVTLLLSCIDNLDTKVEELNQEINNMKLWRLF